MPEDQLKNLIAGRLNAFSPPTITVDDFSIARSTWKSKENFGGAYSYSGVSTLPQHWENMAKPIFDKKWYFCGEHTHSKYRGTVHGGLLSGQYSAQSILDGTT